MRIRSLRGLVGAIMNQGGKNKSKNIVDVLATIQKIVDDEDPGVNSKSGRRAARVPLDELSSRRYAVLDDLPSCLRASGSTALVKRSSGNVVAAPAHSSELPRAMGRIMDTRITELSQVGCDVKSNDRKSKNSGRAIADRYFSAMLPRWPSAPVGNRPGDDGAHCALGVGIGSQELPTVPVNYRQNAFPVPEPQSPGGLPGLPALPMPTRLRSRNEPSNSGTAALDSFTAELLRPLVVDWVNENMPRILEQALSLENSAAKS